MTHRQFMVLGLALSIGVTACRKDPPPPVPTPTPAPTAAPQTQAPPPANNTPPPAPNTNPNAAAEAAARVTAAMRASLSEKVYFDYNESTIRSDSETSLRQKVAILQANPNVRLRIEGHADERGSTEYNLALGNRRAEAVRQYITGFGISADRLTILSYGEERPDATGADESAWSRNRRAEFAITAGGDQLRQP